MAGSSMDIHEHGTLVSIEKIQCNYCQKQMQSFYRLKYHLANVRKDVTPCERVPSRVRMAFLQMIIEGKSGHTACKRLHGQKRGRSVAGKEDLSTSNHDQKCIGRFFYEQCVDFSAVESESFKDMLTLGGSQMGIKIPDSHDLNGWMLQEALKEVQDHVKKIRDSWANTGCSILLDTWVDQKGHDLVAFVADCPAGLVYLKSSHVSDIKNDASALLSLVNGLVEDVGVHNVVQIVACSTSGWVGELGKLFANHNRDFFWSVSLSHCFELMLLKIVKTHSFGDILDKVNNIWEFIKSNPSVLKTLTDQSHGKNITVSSSDFEFVTPYLTLENVSKAKKHLAATFASSDWKKEESIAAISKLVNDSAFWETVERAVKCTCRLIQGVLTFSSNHNQHFGFIHATMEGIKECIARDFNHEEQSYKTLWDVIDEVWNKHLHSPLHAADYFLNPTSFYSNGFNLDPQVATGLVVSLLQVVKESDVRVKIAAQLDMYRLGKDCFLEASEDDQVYGVPSAEWWTKNASHHPELQSFAIKILSQTYEGASRYKLKRGLAEKLLLNDGMSHCEEQHLEDLAYVHYNLYLQSCKAKI